MSSLCGESVACVVKVESGVDRLEGGAEGPVDVVVIEETGVVAEVLEPRAEVEEIVAVEVVAEEEAMDGGTDECELDIVVTVLLSVLVDACEDESFVGGGKDLQLVQVDDNEKMGADPDVNPEERDDDVD